MNTICLNGQILRSSYSIFPPMNKHREACPDCEMAQLRLEAYSDEIEYLDLTLRLQGLQFSWCFPHE